ncbi:MAG: sodium-dependent transporter, partial [Bacteroidales bacterium]
PLGGLFAILFFVILFLAAITSSISLMEVPTTYLIEEGHMDRKKAVAIAFGVTMALGIFCSLSQGALSSLKLFGLSIFDFFNFLSSNVLMTGGGLLLVIFIGWKLGKDAFCDEMTSGGGIRKKKWLLDWYFFAIKYLCPAAITVIFISNLLVK